MDDFEDFVDDNGILRVRRVPSPFVPVRKAGEGPPPIEFDEDQIKEFRQVTLASYQSRAECSPHALPPLSP